MKAALLILTLIFSFGFASAQETKIEESPAASGDAATKENSSYVICRNQKLVRTIRVDLKGLACKAIYTKEGKDDIVGKSGTPDLCYDVVHKIRANLEKHGSWKCKEVEPERVSFTTE